MRLKLLGENGLPFFVFSPRPFSEAVISLMLSPLS